MTKIVVIETVIGKKQQYIKAESKAANGELIPDLTHDVHEAKEYPSLEYAESRIARLRKTFDRVYLPATVEVHIHKRKTLPSQEEFK